MVIFHKRSYESRFCFLSDRAYLVLISPPQFFVRCWHVWGHISSRCVNSFLCWSNDSSDKFFDSPLPTKVYTSGIVGKELWVIADAIVFTIPLSICLLAIVYLYAAVSCFQRKAKKTTFLSVQVARATLERKITKTSAEWSWHMSSQNLPTAHLICICKDNVCERIRPLR